MTELAQCAQCGRSIPDANSLGYRDGGRMFCFRCYQSKGGFVCGGDDPTCPIHGIQLRPDQPVGSSEE